MSIGGIVPGLYVTIPRLVAIVKPLADGLIENAFSDGNPCSKPIVETSQPNRAS
jgi:hypothetical protein